MDRLLKIVRRRGSTAAPAPKTKTKRMSMAIGASLIEGLEDRRLFSGGLSLVPDRFGTPVQPADQQSQNPGPAAQPPKSEPLNNGGTTSTGGVGTGTGGTGGTGTGGTGTGGTGTGGTGTGGTGTGGTGTGGTGTGGTGTGTGGTGTGGTGTGTGGTGTGGTGSGGTGTGGTVTPRATPTAPATDTRDQISESRTLKLRGSSSQSIGHDTDVDMFKINLTAGDIVGFDLDNVPGFATFDGVLRIFDGLGEELEVSDDDEGPGEGTPGGGTGGGTGGGAVSDTEPFIEFLVPLTGTYYVGVSGAGNEEYDAITGAGDEPGSFGPYILRADVLGSDDGNDQIGEAESIGSDATKNGSVNTLTDVDMYRLNARAGQRFFINVDSRNGTNFDSAVQVFNASGQIIATDAGGNSFIDFVAPSRGNFYIAVSGNGNLAYDPFVGDYADDSFGTTGDYRLKVDRR